MNNLAENLTAVAVLITAVATLISVLISNKRIKKIDKEVTTMNSQTIAELEDNTETRRIKKIPEGKRTHIEKAHIKASKETK